MASFAVMNVTVACAQSHNNNEVECDLHSSLHSTTLWVCVIVLATSPLLCASRVKNGRMKWSFVFFFRFQIEKKIGEKSTFVRNIYIRITHIRMSFLFCQTLAIRLLRDPIFFANHRWNSIPIISRLAPKWMNRNYSHACTRINIHDPDMSPSMTQLKIFVCFARFIFLLK